MFRPGGSGNYATVTLVPLPGHPDPVDSLRSSFAFKLSSGETICFLLAIIKEQRINRARADPEDLVIFLQSIERDILAGWRLNMSRSTHDHEELFLLFLKTSPDLVENA